MTWEPDHHGWAAYIMFKLQCNDIDWANCIPPVILYSQNGVLLALPFNPDGSTLHWAIQRDTPERSREGWHTYMASGEALKECREQFPNPPQVRHVYHLFGSPY